MKKSYVVGGLAIVGAIALFAYYSKPRKNSDGFYNASGSRVAGGCDICEGSQGGYWAVYGQCRGNDKCRRAASISAASANTM